MSGLSIQDLRERRHDLATRARALVDNNPGAKWSPEIAAQAEKMFEEIDGYDRQIFNRHRELEAIGRDDSGLASREQWRSSDGRPVAVLAPNERLSGAVGGGATKFGFGAMVRAMVTGTSDPEIKAALSEGTDSAGGYSVPQRVLTEFIDAMRAKSVLIQAGARTVPLDTQITRMVKIASDPVAGWRNENQPVPEGDPTFGAINFNARSLAVLVKISRELLDDSANVEEMLQAAFAGSLAGELDRVGMFGTGLAPQPLGLFGTSGIASQSMGTNGGQLTNWDRVIDLYGDILTANGNQPTAMVMAPRTWTTTAKFKEATTNAPLAMPPALENVQRLVTTNVPVSQTQGTANNASCILLGDFSSVYLGVRQELRIEILRERFADNHQYAFVAHLRADVGIARPGNFGKLIGIVP